MAENGTNLDDVAVYVVALHRSDCFSGTDSHSKYVYVNCSLQFAQICVCQRGVFKNSSVVDQNVYGTVFALNFLETFQYVVLFGHVDHHRSIASILDHMLLADIQTYNLK